MTPTKLLLGQILIVSAIVLAGLWALIPVDCGVARLSAAHMVRNTLVVWQRIVLPDGSSLGFDNVPASDASGYSGLANKAEAHSWALLKGVVISNLLGVGSELPFSGQGGLVQAIRQSGQQNMPTPGNSCLQDAQCPTDPHHPARHPGSVGRSERLDPRAVARVTETKVPDLKLGKLPDRTPVKLTINVDPDLHRTLIDYAELYAAQYGQREAIANLVAAMITAFPHSHRAFSKARSSAAAAK